MEESEAVSEERPPSALPQGPEAPAIVPPARDTRDPYASADTLYLGMFIFGAC